MVGGIFVELVKDSLLRLVSEGFNFFGVDGMTYKHILTAFACHPQPFARFHEQCVHSHRKAGHDLQKASLL